MAKISNIRGAMDVIELLRIFEGLPLEQIRRYLKRVVKAPFPTSSVNVLTTSGTAYYDEEEDYLYLYKGTVREARGTCALEIYLQMCGEEHGPFRFSSAKYPFDYIFEVDHQLYQIIDFSSEGIYKLNFRRHQEQSTDETYKVIPIIMLINTPEDELRLADNRGNYYLLPEDDYIIAHIKFDRIVRKIELKYYAKGESPWQD